MIYTYFLFAPNSTFHLCLNTPSLLKVSTPKISHSGHLLAIQLSWSMQAKNLFSALLFYRHFPFPTLNTLTGRREKERMKCFVRRLIENRVILKVHTS